MITFALWSLFTLAGATPRLRPPLVVLGCELMLQSSFSERAERVDALALVGRMRQRLGPGDHLDFRATRVFGRAGTWTRAQVRRADARLAGLEHALAGGDPDVQVATAVWRGPRLRRALASLPTEFERLLIEYDRQRAHLGQAPRRLTQAAELIVGERFLEFYLHFAARYFETGAASLTPQRLIALGLLPAVAATVPPALTYRWRQYDWHLRNVLRAAAALPDAPTDVLGLSTADAELPREANAMLLATTRPDWFTRQAALEYALPTLAEWFARGLHLNSSWLRKQVGDAGEPSRFVFTDHLMFYDRGEPAWLFAYRAYRRRPRDGRPRPERLKALELNAP